MNLFASIVLISWIPVVILLFANLPNDKAVIFAYIAAWLFLPNGGFALPGLPDYDKATAASLGILVGGLMFDMGPMLAIRFRWFDLPIVLWCLSPFASSISNELGPYDGLSGVVSHVVTYGLPYFTGRIYLGGRDGIRALSIGIFVGALIYVPFCLWEIRMSPQLQSMLYGRSRFGNSVRYGGYRPLVFMNDGLEVGMWMAAASLIGCGLWAGRCIKTVMGWPLKTLLIALLITTILCKSTGSILLLSVGLAVLWVSWRLKSALPALLLASISPLYCGVRATGLWDGRSAVAISVAAFGEERAQSLEFRIDNEDMLIKQAMKSPVFGWGGWGRARVYDENGKDMTVTDGLWIISLGNYGILGLASQIAILTLPIVLICWKIPTRRWNDPAVTPIVAMAMLLALYMIDNLSNAMINPIYYMAAGALLSPSTLDEVRDEHGGKKEVLWRRAEGLENLASRGQASWTESEKGWRALVDLSQDDIRLSAHEQAIVFGRLGYCLARLGRWSDAIEARVRAVEILKLLGSEDHAVMELAEAMNNLAWIMSVSSLTGMRDRDLAVRMSRQAIEVKPGQAAYYNTLGAALIRLGQWSDALIALGRSIALAPKAEIPFNYFLLSIAYVGLGDLAKAHESLRQADIATPSMLREHSEVILLRREATDALASAGKPFSPPMP